MTEHDVTIRDLQKSLDDMTSQRDLLRDAGDRLLANTVDSGCRCRRAWVCHRCVAIEGWKQVRGEKN